MKKFTVLFLFLTSIALSSERTTIPSGIKNQIIAAATADFAALIFNEYATSGAIAPTVANTRWCIYTMCDKDRRYDIFSLAQKLIPSLARAWLSEYLTIESQLKIATLSLESAINYVDEPSVAFLLSTHNSELANSFRLRDHPTDLMRILSNRSAMLHHLLQAGLTRETLPCGWGYIHSAAYAGYTQLIAVLLENGTNVNLASTESASWGKTPLLMLVTTDHQMSPAHLETARILLAAGADTKIVAHPEGKKASELADPHTSGGIRGQLKKLIEAHECTHKLI